MKSTRDKTLEAVAARQRQSLAWPEPERINFKDRTQTLPPHVLNRGGVLGLSGVLTVTGDGVESSPILRRVWVLENLFGQHPPPTSPALDGCSTTRKSSPVACSLSCCSMAHADSSQSETNESLKPS